MQSITPKIFQLHPLLEKAFTKFFGESMERRYYSHFFQQTKYRSDPNNKKILLYSGISSMYLTPVEILFYHLLRERGYDVDYIVYDSTVGYNEITTKDRLDKEGEAFWQRSVKKGLASLDAANVEYQLLSLNPKAVEIANSLPDDTEILFNFNYEGYEIGNIVKGVMYRFYKSISMQDDATQIAKKFMATTLTNYFEIKSRCETNNYHSIMFSHGIYCTWQIIVDYCEANQLDYICYDRGKTKGCINVNRNNPSPVWDISTAWKRLAPYPLSQEQERKVDAYLKERETQKGDVYAYNFSEKLNNLDTLRKTLHIAEGASVITVFTNLIWDAANVSRDIAFDSPLDCICQLVNKYGKNNDYHILVRCHPAEKVLGTHERYGQLVRDAFKDSLPNNVTIVEPEMDINSFDILDMSDIGVVHTSTVGLEMAIEGKPVLLISETHYRNKGFTYDVTDSEDFFATIESLGQSKTTKPNQVELARKYFYLMMFEYQHLMPVNFNTSGSFEGYTTKRFTELTEHQNNVQNSIIEGIESQREDFLFL